MADDVAHKLRVRIVVVAIAVLSAALELAARAGWTSAPHDAMVALARGQAPFLASAFVGVLVLYRATGPSQRAWWTTLSAGVFGECVQLLLRLHAGQPPRALLHSLGFGAGTVAAFALCLAAQRGHPAPRRARDALLAAVALVAFVVLSSSLIDLTRTLHPLTLDAFTYRADEGYGLPVSFAAGTLFEQVPALRVTSHVAYIELPLVCAVVQARELSAKRATHVHALTMIVALGLAGSALYHLFPVAGPAYAFEGRYPYLPPSPERVELAPMLVTAKVARNCMPSLHTAWALSLVWQTRDAPRSLRYMTWLCLALTIAATLGLGYHYVVDLVVAVPFLTAVRALCAWNLTDARRERAAALVVGIALLLGWLVAVRYGAERFASHVALTWLASTATTLLAFAMDVRLFPSAAHGSAPVPERLRAAAERRRAR
jgi:hypothetical protein